MGPEYVEPDEDELSDEELEDEELDEGDELELPPTVAASAFLQTVPGRHPLSWALALIADVISKTAKDASRRSFLVQSDVFLYVMIPTVW